MATPLDKLLKVEDPATEIEKLSFEQGVALLETLVGQVEEGEVPLEASILAYERGSLLLNHLRKLLSGAEEKLKVIQDKNNS